MAKERESAEARKQMGKIILTSCIKSRYRAKRTKALHGQLSDRLFLEIMET
jgi:hypothetical protein